MRSSRLRRSSVYSRQGSQTPQNNRQKLKQKQKLSEDIKAKYITQLQQRNRKLKYQIIKINEILQQQKDTKGATKKQYKLIPTQSSAQVLKKQLQNAYKLIKTYEHQINLLQNKHSGGLITDKMSRMQNIFKEKSKHLDKLKSQLIKLTKQSNQNNSKQRIENILLKYNQEIKILRDRVRNTQDIQKKKVQNAKKQYQYIKKLQRQLMENGVPMDEIDQQFIYSYHIKIYRLKRNNIYIQIYDKLNNPDRQKEVKEQSSPANKLQKSKAIQNNQQQTKQQIQDMTIDRFLELKNQVKLYQKLHEDYAKKLNNLEKQKNIEEKLTQAARKKLQQKQKQISGVQNEVAELKAKIRNLNLKANYQPPAVQPVVKKQKPKMPASKLKQNSPQKKSLSDQTHIKFDQKGQVSSKGQRFTDRTIIGKASNIKIVGFKIWTQKNSSSICGIQCRYKINDQLKYGEQHITKDTKKYCIENKMQLADGDYIKAISGHISPNNIIQYLVFISNSSIIGRFGVAKPTQKQFNFDIQDDQIPICMYGSIGMVGMNLEGEKKEVSLLEQLGFQITSDKMYGKDML